MSARPPAFPESAPEAGDVVTLVTHVTHVTDFSVKGRGRDAAELLRDAIAEGVTLRLVDPENVEVIGADEALERWVPILRNHKAAIIDALHSPDDRRHCAACMHLAGSRCRAAGVLVLDDLPRRCADYQPLPTDPDQRTGAERWPWMIQPPMENDR